MLLLNNNVDYAKHFEKIKQTLWETNDIINRNKEGKYAYAYGKLSMGVKILLVACTTGLLEDIQKYLDSKPDDLPKDLFTIGTADIEKEGIEEHKSQKAIKQYAESVANESGHSRGSAAWFEVYNIACKSIRALAED